MNLSTIFTTTHSLCWRRHIRARLTHITHYVIMDCILGAIYSGFNVSSYHYYHHHLHFVAVTLCLFTHLFVYWCNNCWNSINFCNDADDEWEETSIWGKMLIKDYKSSYLVAYVRRRKTDIEINKKRIKDVNDISKRRQKLIYNAHSAPLNSPLSHSLSQVCDSLLIDVCLLPCAMGKMRKNFSK